MNKNVNGMLVLLLVVAGATTGVANADHKEWIDIDSTSWPQQEAEQSAPAHAGPGEIAPASREGSALLLPAVQKARARQGVPAAGKPRDVSTGPQAGIEPDEIDAASRATAERRVPARSSRSGRRSLQRMMLELSPRRAMLVRAQARAGMPQPGSVQARPAGPPKYEIADCGTSASPMICCHHEDGDGSSCNLFKILCENAGGTAQGDGESAACSDW